MTNKAIARYLKQTSELIELTGGNPFRARAFSRAARALDQLDEPATELMARNQLTEVPGIGAGLAADIRKLVTEGTFEVLDELLAALPPGVLDLLRIKGLGAKRVRQLWQERDITTLDELEDAAAAGYLADLDGFGPKTQQKILDNVRQFRHYQQRRRYADLMHDVQSILEALRGLAPLQRVEPTGALRRALETVETAELIAATEDIGAARAALASVLPEASFDDTTVTSHLPDGFPLRLYLSMPDAFGSAWWRTTGSDVHVEAFEARFGTPQPAAEEKDLFEAAGLPFIPPELREADGELDAAAKSALPQLIAVDDLRGNLHNHSTYSDGAHTLRQMAEAARAIGLSYFGICDHSQSLKIAHGMSMKEVARQQEEIRALNEEFAHDGDTPFRIFSGTESDILPDGSLDYPDEVLASFDFVVASVHTRFNMTEKEATDRLRRAVANPYTTILGHPTGRLLLSREGYPLDHEAVIDACAEHGVALELNANPYRLDVDWRWIRRATAQGVLLSINPDAHSMDQLSYVRWGVAVARKGWLEPRQCLNTMTLSDFSAWLDRRKEAPVP